MTILSLYLFIALLIICGFAVDLIRQERERVALQNLTDSAVLAATRIDDNADPRALIQDYFDKAGRSASLGNVNVTGDASANEMVITVSTQSSIDTIFMGLIGTEALPVGTVSSAAQSATDIEISLVLDISSSMNGSSRLPRLKQAVREFADAVVPLDPFSSASDVSVNVVPYSLSVNPGPLAKYYTIDGKHSFQDCIWFETTDYASLGMPRNQSFERYTHMADGSSGYESDGTVNLPMCPRHEISPLLTTRQQITDAVDALTGWDGTGIDIGAKWGLAMLDPEFQTVVDGLIGETIVDTRMSGRPFAYGNSEKFLIIMSDGENDSQRDLHARLRSGPAPLWRDAATGDISVLVEDGRDPDASPQLPESTSRWYHVDTDDIRAYPDTSGASGQTDWDMVGSQMVQLTWPDVFDIARTNDVYNKFFKTADQAGYLTSQEAQEYRSPINFNRITETDTNKRLKDICQLATASGVTVFAISFDPPSDLARDTLRDCASVPGNFFAVDGVQISTAFESIAREISKVRLTQ